LRPCRYVTGPSCSRVPCPGETNIAHCEISRAAIHPRPGPVAKVGNAVKAVVAHVADNGRVASPAVQAQRMAICRACPEFEPTAPACRRCGCGTVVKGGLELKLSWASSECPLNPPRWKSV
jgi:hypothetical protein